MQANMKYNYPACKWVATQFLLPFLWGILLTQTFHFHPVIEEGTSHSLIHVSSLQKIVYYELEDNILAAYSITDGKGCEVFPGGGLMAIDG